ncbi:MAG TPA: substrate-binding domain-containing protein [Candidatus Sumerlaeota bacterium]|nr:MAG: Catabolite control protein A [candidate division BRC1 bacterium ADurb.BinA292]HOE95395.1 substrate-binding domain-containing protein [Candidatus Sumerlaeota bacterium]HOR27058.1 substrate-binding domain-containing protein [Candidatus Sumerlaeota bacterium]HPK01607.1 substrate-binding domain-containing protein [Candidatus Sumerlaeota bacterium]
MSKEHPQLFGRPIFPPDQGLTLTSQVREILLEEIHGGHWEVGERLPSVATLARQSGLSRWPIQEAFESLRKEGYLRQSSRSGTYLESLAPQGRKPLGSIGIVLMLEEEQGNWKTPPFTQYRLGRVIEMAEQRNFAVEVKYLRPSDDWSRVDQVGGVFSDKVIGVIALNPFHHPAAFELPPDRLPFVHIGGASQECHPTVAGDTMLGFYKLTRRIIEVGHRNIICFCNPTDPEWETQSRLDGHARAMNEAGLRVNEEACRRSMTIAEGDLAGLRTFLEEFRDATAIICMWGGVDFHIVQVATMMGIRVPEDLSVTGHGAGPMGTKSGATMTCLEYDMNAMLNACFDLLQVQRTRRRAEFSQILSNPLIHEGDSLAPPPPRRPALAGAASGLAGRNRYLR